MTSLGGRYLLKTLGCKANLSDSQLLESELQKKGWKPAEFNSEITADLCIINSCTVTDEADKQSRKLALRLLKDHPRAKIVITGCAAEVDPELMAEAPGIHYVVGNRDKPDLVNLVLASLEEKRENGILGRASNYDEMLSRHPIDREWATPESAFMIPPARHRGEAGRTRTFLKIQEGCNSFCTYCVIPYGRGPSRSLGIPEIVAQISELVKQGVQEVVITGTNVGDYGIDWNKSPGQPQLTELFEAIFSQTELPRLRVSSLDPTEITPGLFALMRREPRFQPHFHVSLQSPHSKILKLMKRKYQWEQVQECLHAIADLRAPIGGPFVGMDLITGFPGETLSDFEWGCEALASLPWSRLHVFPFSERKGTPATRLPLSVPQQERVRRARILRELSFERSKRSHHDVLVNSEKTGTPLDRVLFESKTKGPSPGIWVAGYSANYLRVLVPVKSEDDALALNNKIHPVMPLSLILDSAAGEVAFMGRLA